VLKSAYCGGIGVEFMHIADMDQQNWIRDKFEKQAEILKSALYRA
jgi:2-oxoglutarate dehydrogenase complex dehydrogenase (E1) component-like enzyme